MEIEYGLSRRVVGAHGAIQENRFVRLQVSAAFLLAAIPLLFPAVLLLLIVTLYTLLALFELYRNTQFLVSQAAEACGLGNSTSASQVHLWSEVAFRGLYPYGLWFNFTDLFYQYV